MADHVGGKRACSLSTSPVKQSTPKKAARARDLLLDSSSDESTLEAARNLENALLEDDESAPTILSFLSCEEGQQQQEQEDNQGWTVSKKWKRRAGHQQSPRPKFKLGYTGDHESDYQAITALELEHPTLKMEVRPNLSGVYILTPKNEDSAALLRRIAEEGNKVIVLEPSEKRHKMVLERYPLNLPLDAVKAHPQVASAERLCSGREKVPTRQVLLVHVGPPPA